MDNNSPAYMMPDFIARHIRKEAVKIILGGPFGTSPDKLRRAAFLSALASKAKILEEE